MGRSSAAPVPYLSCEILLGRGGLGFGLGGFGSGCGGDGFVPLEGAAEAFLEIDGGGVAEEIACGGDVGLRIADVALAVRVVLGFHWVTGNLAKELDDFVQGEAASDTDVENFAGDVARRFKGEQVGLHGVFNVGEIARLFAVAKNDRSRFVERGGAEFCEHAGIGRAGILARAENVEIAKAYVFEAVTAAEGL